MKKKKATKNNSDLEKEFITLVNEQSANTERLVYACNNAVDELVKHCEKTGIPVECGLGRYFPKLFLYKWLTTKTAQSVETVTGVSFSDVEGFFDDGEEIDYVRDVIPEGWVPSQICD